MLASNFVSSDTSTDVDNDPWSAIDVLTSLHAPVRSSLMVHERPVTRKEPSLKYQPSTRVRGQFYLEDSSLS